MSGEDSRNLTLYPYRGFGCLEREHPEPARIIVIHDDIRFSNELVDRLRLLGHEVRLFNDLAVTVRSSSATDVVEIAIVRPSETRGGLRIKAVGIPADEACARPLVKFLVDPITVMNVIDALEIFLR